MQDDAITLVEVGKVFGVFWRTVARWVHDGRLIATGERPDSLVSRADLDRFYKQHEVLS